MLEAPIKLLLAAIGVVVLEKALWGVREDAALLNSPVPLFALNGLAIPLIPPPAINKKLKLSRVTK